MNKFNEIYGKYIKGDVRLLTIFNDVNLKVEKSNRKWFFDYFDDFNNPNKNGGCLGETRVDSKYISITFKALDDENKMKSLIIHELGEADYILSGLPIIKVNDQEVGDLPELITHLYISKLIDKYGLNDFVYSNLKYYENINEITKKEKWEIITMMIRALITYPNERKDIEKSINNLKEDIILEINKVLNIIEGDDLFTDKKSIVDKYEQIIQVLKDNGLSEGVAKRIEIVSLDD